MKKSTMQFKSQGAGLLTVGVCTLLFSLGSAQAAFAQQTVAARPVASPAISSQPAGAPAAAKPVAEEEETAKPGKPGGEGIKIHGHWVLQVKNADGTLGERREFNNSLVTTYSSVNNVPATTSGSALLAAALSGTMAVGNPAIGFVQGPLVGDPSLWCSTSGTASGGLAPQGTSCYGYAPTNSLYNFNSGNSGVGSNVNGLVYMTLGLSETVNFTPTASIVFTGNYPIPSGLTSISAVQSLYCGCVNSSLAIPSYMNNLYDALQNSANVRTADVSSSTCTHSFVTGSTGQFEFSVLGALTSTAVQNSSGVAQPLVVTPGQAVTVTLTISFS